MKTNKNLALALTLAFAVVVAAEKTFADDSEQVIRVEIVQPEQTQAQKQQAYLDNITRKLEEASRQDSIEQQNFVDQRIYQNRQNGPLGRLTQ